jgi:hypothetical protein
VSASRPAELPAGLRHAAFIPKPFEERAVLNSIAQAKPRRAQVH